MFFLQRKIKLNKNYFRSLSNLVYHELLKVEFNQCNQESQTQRQSDDHLNNNF